MTTPEDRDEVTMKIFARNHPDDQQLPKPTVVVHNWATSEWHYPSRLHARPGRYEDEYGNLWEFQSSPLTGTNLQWVRLPQSLMQGAVHAKIPTDIEGLPIHVRWVGELDELV